MVGGSVSGASQSSTRQDTGRPVSSMAGTKTAASSQSDGSSRRSRRQMATAPKRSPDIAISDPARANISDIAGKSMVRNAQPVTW